MAKSVPTFFTVVATDRKWSSRAILGVSDGENRLGNPRAVLIRPENTSGTRGTVAVKCFRFAVATVENGRMGPD